MKKILSRLKIIIFLILCIIISGYFLYGITVLKIKWHGINIKPGKIFKPKDAAVFLQNDEKWSNIKLGKSGYTIGSHGCLLSVIASSLVELEYKTDPVKLNKLFTRKDVFNKSGFIIWYKIKEAVPSVNYKYSRIFNSRKIEKYLTKGYLPIVKVKYYKTGMQHWVIIVGSDKNDFLVIDPLNPDKKPIPLQTHGKVYAYRVLVKNKVTYLTNLTGYFA